ncbi:MAG: hypothetical protein OXG29_12190 [Gammaproteobacteria bacterium]|nr:hypothetical protein [Gammaproteobacteria bacterium]
MAALHCANSGEKLLPGKRAGATEGRAGAVLDELRHSAYVIVVPVRGHDQGNVPGRIKTNAFKVAQSSWLSVFI